MNSKIEWQNVKIYTFFILMANQLTVDHLQELNLETTINPDRGENLYIC